MLTQEDVQILKQRHLNGEQLSQEELANVMTYKEYTQAEQQLQQFVQDSGVSSLIQRGKSGESLSQEELAVVVEYKNLRTAKDNILYGDMTFDDLPDVVKAHTIEKAKDKLSKNQRGRRVREASDVDALKKAKLVFENLPPEERKLFIDKTTYDAGAGSLPELLEMGVWDFTEGMDASHGSKALTTFLSTSTSAEELAKILQAQYGNQVSISYVPVPGSSDVQINATNVKTGVTVALNRPGLSTTDVVKALGIATTFTPAGLARTAAVRIGTTAAISAGVQATQAAAGGDFNPEEVILDTALAGGGELAGVVVKSAAKKMTDLTRISGRDTLKKYKAADRVLTTITPDTPNPTLSQRQQYAKRGLEILHSHQQGRPITYTNKEYIDILKEDARQDMIAKLPERIKDTGTLKQFGELMFNAAQGVIKLKKAKDTNTLQQGMNAALDGLITNRKINPNAVGNALTGGALGSALAAYRTLRHIRSINALKGLPDEEVLPYMRNLAQENPKEYNRIMMPIMESFMKDAIKVIKAYPKSRIKTLRLRKINNALKAIEDMPYERLVPATSNLSSESLQQDGMYQEGMSQEGNTQ